MGPVHTVAPHELDPRARRLGRCVELTGGEEHG